jgi:hypothetical protein
MMQMTRMKMTPEVGNSNHYLSRQQMVGRYWRLVCRRLLPVFVLDWDSDRIGMRGDPAMR